MREDVESKYQDVEDTFMSLAETMQSLQEEMSQLREAEENPFPPQVRVAMDFLRLCHEAITNYVDVADSMDEPEEWQMQSVSTRVLAQAEEATRDAACQVIFNFMKDIPITSRG